MISLRHTQMRSVHRHLGDRILGSDGFFLKLTHPTGRVVDLCGNLDGDPRTDDLPTWTLPGDEDTAGTPHVAPASFSRQ